MGKLNNFILAAAVISLAACSGGSDDTLSGGSGSGGGGGGTGGGGGSGSPGGGGSDPVIQLGSGFGSSFQSGTLQLGVTELSAGGSTGVTATLVTGTGDLYTGDATISFNSPCVGQGLASITTPVETSTGIANTTYAATGCNGSDVITATATVDGTTMTASGTVDVAPASVGSIQFISATPSNIGLKGTGGAGRSETSVVVFRVVDSTGGPVPNVDVTFSLNSTVGGVAVSPSAGDPPATTDFDGRVQAVVQSGTVATTVRVTATVLDVTPQIGTQSDQLTITTGLPDQDSMSLSIETLNPEAWNVDGVEVPVTIRLSDRFNNPVPDGTAVTFRTEGGQIGSQCLTSNGACSVDWVSQSPRPADGRVTILASAIGEESFEDGDGNGVYNGSPDTFDDIPEPFRDDNWNGVRDDGAPLEPFVDFNTNGSYDLADGEFNGLLCDTSATDECSGTETVAVFEQAEIVMSGCDVDFTGFLAAANAPVSISGLFQDDRGQPLPQGTTISFDTDNGEIQGPSSFTYPNTTVAQNYGVTVAADDESSDGPLFITVTCPSGVETYHRVEISD